MNISKNLDAHQKARFSVKVIIRMENASMAGTHFYHANAWLCAWHTVATQGYLLNE